MVDLELHLGTWVAWGRKAADDPALLRALARLREEYSAAFPAETAARCWRPADDRDPARAMDNRGMPDVFEFPVPFGAGAVALAAVPAR